MKCVARLNEAMASTMAGLAQAENMPVIWWNAERVRKRETTSEVMNAINGLRV